MKLPSPAMGVALASLVIALGGTSYAASQVNGSDIKAKSIGNSKIKKNTIGPGTIKDGKLTAKEFAPGVLSSTKPTRWAYVDRNGAITAQSGGFTVVAAYPVLANTAVDPAPSNALRANGNVYIDAGEDLTDNGIVATIQLQNTVNQDGGGMAGRDFTADSNAEFSGEITVSKCNVGAAGTPTATGPTNCAPTGAQNANSFVVSPRLSDGQATGGADGTTPNRKGFFVVITG